MCVVNLLLFFVGRMLVSFARLGPCNGDEERSAVHECEFSPFVVAEGLAAYKGLPLASFSKLMKRQMSLQVAKYEPNTVHPRSA